MRTLAVRITFDEDLEMRPPTIARPSQRPTLERDQSRLRSFASRLPMSTSGSCSSSWLPAMPSACRAMPWLWMKSRRSSPAEARRVHARRCQSGMASAQASQNERAFSTASIRSLQRPCSRARVPRVEAAQREELARANPERRVLHLDQAPEDLRGEDHLPHDRGVLVAMVVEDADARRRPDRVAVEVGEHLLAALQADVEEEDDRDRLVAKLGALLQRQLDRGAAMLAVVDDEARFHGNVQQADPARRARHRARSRSRPRPSIEAVRALNT